MKPTCHCAGAEAAAAAGPRHRFSRAGLLRLLRLLRGRVAALHVEHRVLVPVGIAQVCRRSMASLEERDRNPCGATWNA